MTSKIMAGTNNAHNDVDNFTNESDDDDDEDG